MSKYVSLGKKNKAKYEYFKIKEKVAKNVNDNTNRKI